MKKLMTFFLSMAMLIFATAKVLAIAPPTLQDETSGQPTLTVVPANGSTIQIGDEITFPEYSFMTPVCYRILTEEGADQTTPLPGKSKSYTKPFAVTEAMVSDGQLKILAGLMEYDDDFNPVVIASATFTFTVSTGEPEQPENPEQPAEQPLAVFPPNGSDVKIGETIKIGEASMIIVYRVLTAESADQEAALDFDKDDGCMGGLPPIVVQESWVKDGKVIIRAASMNMMTGTMDKESLFTFNVVEGEPEKLVLTVAPADGSTLTVGDRITFPEYEEAHPVTYRILTLEGADQTAPLLTVKGDKSYTDKTPIIVTKEMVKDGQLKIMAGFVEFADDADMTPYVLESVVFTFNVEVPLTPPTFGLVSGSVIEPAAEIEFGIDPTLDLAPYGNKAYVFWSENDDEVTLECAAADLQDVSALKFNVATFADGKWTVAPIETQRGTARIRARLALLPAEGGLVYSEIVTATYTVRPETVAAPTFDVPAGEVEKGTPVTMTSATEGAKIYYTADGTEPTAESTEYREAVKIEKDMTLKAVAIKGEVKSTVTMVSYTVRKETVATPTFSIPAGEVKKGTKVSIACVTEDAKIYYTVDGSEPTAKSTEYKEAVVIEEAMTLKAIAIKGDIESEIATAVYTVPTANEELELAGVSLYPNPSYGEFHIELPVAARVEMFGSNGVLRQRVEAGAGLLTLTVDHSGVYFIRITGEGRTTVKRVVVR